MGIFGDSEERTARKAEKDQLRSNIESAQQEIRWLDSSIEETETNAKIAMSDERALVAKKWEYAVEDNADDERLNFYGSRGWEMVNAASYTTGWGIGGNEKMTVNMRYVFKRPLPDTHSEMVASLLEEIERLGIRKSEAVNRLEQLNADYHAW